MASIPISAVPNVQPGQGRALQISSSRVQAVGRATTKAAGAIDEAAQVTNEVFERKQLAEDSASIAEANRVMKLSAADYQQQIAQEGDETKWEEMWSKNSVTTKAALLNDKSMRPAVRNQISASLDEWTVNGDIEARGQATKRGMQRSKAKHVQAAETALEFGDFEEYERILDSMVETRLMEPGEKQNAIASGERRMDYFDAVGEIEDNPKQALIILTDDTNFTNLSPAERNSLKGAARGRITAQQKDVYNGMLLDIEKGVLIHPDKVLQMADTGDLTAPQASAYIKQYHSASPQGRDMSRYPGVRRAIDAYNPGDDASGERFNELLGDTIGFPKADVARLRNLLETKFEPTHESNRGIVAEGMKSIEGWTDIGLFGDVSLKTIGKERGKPNDPAAFKRAHDQEIMLKDEADKFWSDPKNKGANRQDFQKHMSGSIKTARSAGAISLLSPSPAAPSAVNNQQRLAAAIAAARERDRLSGIK